MIRSRKQARARRMIRSKERSRANRRIKPQPNWLKLPPEVTSMILLKLDAIEILTSAQHVFSLWYKICKEPHMWRIIDMKVPCDSYEMDHKFNLEIMCMHAVYRSRGQLVDISIAIGYYTTDNLLRYITQRAKQLKRLRIADGYNITNKGWTKAIPKLALLEHLELIRCSFRAKHLKTVGQRCPRLKSLKLNGEFWKGKKLAVSDKKALAIGETMPNLCHLEIIANPLTDRGLQAILDGCPNLEFLDLRKCSNLNLAGQLRQKCAERIKVLHLPHDPIADYKSTTEVNNFLDYVSEDEPIAGYGFGPEVNNFLDYVSEDELIAGYGFTPEAHHLFDYFYEAEDYFFY